MKDKFTILLVLFSFTTCVCANIVVDLGGNAWNVSNGRNVSSGATVPGQIHTDLLAAGVIGDPYFRFNDVEQRWVAMDNWTYSRGFEISDAVLALPSIELQFDGLDTVAEVILNSVSILKSDNMFLRYRVDVKALLKADNNLIVRFTSAVSYATSQAVNWNKTSFDIPPDCPAAIQNGFCHPNFIRKEPCSFSWDWGPAFAPQGIYKAVRIVAHDYGTLSDVLFEATPTQVLPKPTLDGPLMAFSEKRTWKFQVSAVVNAATDHSAEVYVLLNGTTVASSSVSISAGRSKVTLEGSVDDVLMWWPRGYGSPTLYNLSVALVAGGTTYANQSVFVGFRTVELLQNPSGSGKTFFFAINNVPVFIKGANWIPADSWENRVTPSYLAHLFHSYASANFNCLRVWGGGLYQQDLFYEMADRMGILIWEEFMFACSLYPNNTEFMTSVRDEVADQVSRLQHHASIMLWSGNNENEAAIAENWWHFPASMRQTYVDMYSQLYFDTVIATIPLWDTSRPVLASSPSNGNETRTAAVSVNPQDPSFGDVHYYNYLADCWDVGTFPRPRFASEFGFQSFTSLEGLRAVSIAEDWHFNSSFVAHRQHHPAGNAEIIAQTTLHFDWPSGDDEAAFQLQVWMSQVMQGYCIKSESEHYRRIRSEDGGLGGKTMGTLYWQANDIWQGASWASIEYGGRWKVLQYLAMHMYQPVIASMYSLNQSIGVYLVNDMMSPIAGTVTFTLLRWQGGSSSFSVPFKQAALNSSSIYDDSIQSFLQKGSCPSINDCMVTFDVRDDAGSQLSTNFFYLGSLHQAKLANPNLVVSSVDYSHETTSASGIQYQAYAVKVTSQAVATLIWLETASQGYFEDNAFSMPAGERTVMFYASSSSTPKINIWSYYDVQSRA